MLPSTLQFFIVMFACSINERLQKAVDYKTEDVHVLKEILRSVTHKNRIDFTEAQRRRLARVGKDLTPRERDEHCEIVRPRTILEWFRRIYATKYDSSRTGRTKRTPPAVRDRRIHGPLSRGEVLPGLWTARSIVPLPPWESLVFPQDTCTLVSFP